MSETKTDKKTAVKVVETSSRVLPGGRLGVVVAIDEHVIPASRELLIQSREPLDRAFRCEKIMIFESTGGCTSIVRFLMGDRPVVLENKSDPVKSQSFHYQALGNGVDTVIQKGERPGALVRNDSAQDIKVAVTIFGHSFDPTE